MSVIFRSLNDLKVETKKVKALIKTLEEQGGGRKKITELQQYLDWAKKLSRQISWHILAREDNHTKFGDLGEDDLVVGMVNTKKPCPECQCKVFTLVYFEGDAIYQCTSPGPHTCVPCWSPCGGCDGRAFMDSNCDCYNCEVCEGESLVNEDMFADNSLYSEYHKTAMRTGNILDIDEIKVRLAECVKPELIEKILRPVLAE